MQDHPASELIERLTELEAELLEYAELTKDAIPFSLGVPTFERWAVQVREASSALIASREAVLREALAAARDTLAAFQKQAGVIPGQGISATMTEAEVQVARAVADINRILADTALIASRSVPGAVLDSLFWIYSQAISPLPWDLDGRDRRQELEGHYDAVRRVLIAASSGAGGETASPVRTEENAGSLRSYGPSLSDGPEASSQRPSQDDIDRLEKAAWDSKTDQVLVWYRDRLDQHAAALDAAWQDLQDWCKTARGMRERSREPKGPNFDPACPSVAGIEKTEVVIRQIGAALTAADLGLCPTCGRDLRGSFPECIDCQVVTALKGGGDGD